MSHAILNIVAGAFLIPIIILIDIYRLSSYYTFEFNGPIKKVSVSKTFIFRIYRFQCVDMFGNTYSHTSVTNPYEYLAKLIIKSKFKFKNGNFSDVIGPKFNKYATFLDLTAASKYGKGRFTFKSSYLPFEEMPRIQQYYEDILRETVEKAVKREKQPAQTLSPWQVLGVKQGATKEQIAARYKALMRISHPDINPDVDEEYVKTLNSAYEKLKG